MGQGTRKVAMTTRAFGKISNLCIFYCMQDDTSVIIMVGFQCTGMASQCLQCFR